MSFPLEARAALTVLIILAIALELFSLSGGLILKETVKACMSAALALLSLYLLLYYLYSAILDRYTALKVKGELFLALPILILAFLLRKSFPLLKDGEEGFIISYGLLALILYCLWFLVKLTLKKRYLEIAICLIGDIVMIYAFIYKKLIFSDSIWEKLIFAALFALTLSLIRLRVPFVYFLILMLILLFTPLKEEPINWKPLIEKGEKLIESSEDLARSISYQFSELFKLPGYHSGYSSLENTGGSLTMSERTELKLKTMDRTSFFYTDEESGKSYRVKRAIYLKGVKELEKEPLLDMLLSLYAHGVKRNDATLFARSSRLDISYEYLKTRDEILPENLIYLKSPSGDQAPFSKKEHKRGYELNTRFLELDYGSPYLAEIIKKPVYDIKKTGLSYENMSSYAFEVYGISLRDWINEEDYKLWQEKDRAMEEYLLTEGSGERLKDLALEITKGLDSEYERSLAIEAYLRQYPYRTDTKSLIGGSSADPEGMSKMTEDFLFDTGAGYCVHHAVAMVMLLRLNGIPARLNIGYRYVFPYEKQDSYELKGSSAHAWPEAYISGFGWVGFEPSSIYSTSVERTWHRHPPKNKGEAQGEGEEGYREKYKDILYPTPEVNFYESSYAAIDREKIRTFIKISLILLLTLLMVFLLTLLGSGALKLIRYNRADMAAKVILDIEDIKRILLKRNDKAFNDRGLISDYLPLVPKSHIKEAEEAFAIYYRIRYKYKENSKEKVIVSPLELLKVRTLRDQLKSLKKRK